MSDDGRIRVFPSGKSVNPLNVRREDVDIRDIARSLSHVARFGGHTCSGDAYTVGQHSIYVSQRVAGGGEYDNPSSLTVMNALGLLHDASEAYLHDIPAPLKMQPEFGFYRAAEVGAMGTIMGRFGLLTAHNTHEYVVAVAYADRMDLHAEQRDLRDVEPPIPLHAPFDRRIYPWEAGAVEQRFLHMWELLAEAGVVAL